MSEYLSLDEEAVNSNAYTPDPTTPDGYFTVLNKMNPDKRQMSIAHAQEVETREIEIQEIEAEWIERDRLVNRIVLASAIVLTAVSIAIVSPPSAPLISHVLVGGMTLLLAYMAAHNAISNAYHDYKYSSLMQDNYYSDKVYTLEGLKKKLEELGFGKKFSSRLFNAGLRIYQSYNQTDTRKRLGMTTPKDVEEELIQIGGGDVVELQF